MNKYKKIARYIKNPLNIILYFGVRGKLKFIPDSVYLKLMYYDRLGKKLNLKDPKTFNEKLQWLKLYDRNPIYTNLVDKYEVRHYISDKIGEEHLIPILGIYDSFEDIDFDNLPNQFVLKCTHDSGGLIICKDKSKLDKDKARNKINKCLKKNYYYHGREWPYKNVKPRIICEKYMVDDLEGDIKDYKFMCFNGDVKCLFVASNRHKECGINLDYYDTNWVKMPFEKVGSPNSNKDIKKPKTFDKMIKFAEKLSNNIPFVRIDFYEINGKLYFGEITFYPDSGMAEFYPNKYDEILGSWIDLQ